MEERKNGYEERTEERKRTEGVSQEQWDRWKKRSAICTAVAVMLYICCVVPVILCSAFGWKEEIGVIFLFLFIAAATGILIVNSMTKPSAVEVCEETGGQNSEKSKRKAKGVYSSLWSLITVLYLLISFSSGAWQITWLIFPIGAVIQTVLKTCIGDETGTAARVISILFSVISSVALLLLIIYAALMILRGDLPIGIRGGTIYSGSENYTSGNVSYELKDGLRELHIDWSDGAVNVEAVEGLSKIEIAEEGSDDIPQKDRVHSYYHNGILEIRYRESGRYLLQSQTSNKKLRVRIPGTAANGIEKIEGDSVSADMTFSNLTAEKFTVDSVSGLINYAGNVRDTVEADIVSSEVRMELLSVPDSIKTDSVSGTVQIALPGDASFEAELDSMSGGLYSAFPESQYGKNRKSVVCREGKGDFEFNSVSGSVELHPVA